MVLPEGNKAPDRKSSATVLGGSRDEDARNRQRTVAQGVMPARAARGDRVRNPYTNNEIAIA
jgi:hypothetical protein